MSYGNIEEFWKNAGFCGLATSMAKKVCKALQIVCKRKLWDMAQMSLTLLAVWWAMFGGLGQEKGTPASLQEHHEVPKGASLPHCRRIEPETQKNFIAVR